MALADVKIPKLALRSIPHGGFFDCHPILVPATIFFVCWIPYISAFIRRTISFGDLGGAWPVDSFLYWILFAVQIGVCVVSHSLTIRTIVRLYAPSWLIWGSVAFYALSPAWGLMTAADIRHPLFAAVFCVFTSSCVFALFSKKVPKWLWVQLAGGALSVCLLRAEGIWIVLPTLVAIVAFKLAKWRSLDETGPIAERMAVHFKHLRTMKGSMKKASESLWADACAAFLVLSAVGLLFLLTYCVGWSLPLGQPSFGASSTAMTLEQGQAMDVPLAANLTGTNDVGGIIPQSAIWDNSIYTPVAVAGSNLIFALQCLPLENLTFSWVAYLVLFGAFLAFAILVCLGLGSGRIDLRPMIVGLAMMVIVCMIAFDPSDATLRYLMPVLAAQPMFFGSIFATLRDAASAPDA